jgi:transglutaminase-like putative cysteine protease
VTVEPSPTAPPRWARLLGDLSRPPEHSRALRLATLVAVVAAASAVVANDVGGGPLWVLALGVIPAGAVVSYVRRRSTSPLVPGILTAITIVLTARFILANGGAASPGELRVPLAELLVTLEAVRAFSLRSRRELGFALASSIALIAVAGALSLGIEFAAFAAVWGIAAVAALALAHRADLGDLAAPGGDRRAGVPISPRALAAALLAVGALGAAVFLIVPAAKSSRFLAFTARLPSQIAVPSPGGLSNPSLGRDDPARPGTDSEGPASFGYFGFSDRLDTSLRGRPDDTMVLRVRSAAADFWRGQTFDVWDGRVWTLSDPRTVSVRGSSPLRLFDPQDEPPIPGQDLVQTFYLETSGPNVIFAANRPTQVYIPQSTLFELSDGSVRTGVELERGAVYTVVSRRPHATAQRLRATGDASKTATPAPLLERYTRLPAIPERVRDLAASITRDTFGTYDTVQALERWMGANTRYSLDIPPLPPGADAVDRFLFEDRIGFCEQIGSSLVVMLRSLGIPARLAVGYAPGERNPFTGLYEVRARDAHAWAEVYFPGIGWQGFDPTAQVPLAGDPQPDAARVGLRDYLGRHLPDLSTPLIAVLGVALALGAVALWWRPLAVAWARRRDRRRPRGWAAEQLGRLETIGRELGRDRLPGETAHEYAAALERTVLRDPRLEAIADALTADAFADAHLDAAERDRVESLIGTLADRSS